MIDINDVKEFVEYISNKEQTGNTMSPAEFNVIARRADLDLFKIRTGLPEEYKVGAPLSRQAWQLTSKITNDLRVFIKEDTITVDSDGLMELPDDYLRESSILYKFILNAKEVGGEQTVQARPVDIIDDNKWAYRISSKVKTPSKKYPVCRFRADKIEFAPVNLERVNFTYLRIPTTPVWGFNIVNDVEVYDASKSTQFEWATDNEVDLTSLILSYIGMNLSNDKILKYGEMIKSKGA